MLLKSNSLVISELKLLILIAGIILQIMSFHQEIEFAAAEGALKITLMRII